MGAHVQDGGGELNEMRFCWLRLCAFGHGVADVGGMFDVKVQVPAEISLRTESDILRKRGFFCAPTVNLDLRRK